MSKIIGIDPGTTQSGWVVFDGECVVECGVADNEELLSMIYCRDEFDELPLAIEMIASYGMPVGKEVFETCVWIGRFMQAAQQPDSVKLVYRKDVKIHLCGTSKAKDANIRQAVIDLFQKSKRGPLYGMSTHMWPALAVAITALAAKKKPLARKKLTNG
jgi:Holliday junction resolvasome RuvABC endonuclease subunit